MPTLQSINPTTGKVIARYESINAEAQERALISAEKAFQSWKELSHKERSKFLKAVAKELRQQQQALAELATLEMGKPIAQSQAEVAKCARTFDYYAKEGPAMLADQMVKTEGRSFVHFQPLGTVLAIMPWNFPYWQVFRCAAPILMAGNAMLLKHAGNVSGCALAIEKVFRKAGLPKGLFQTLLLPSAEVEDLIADPRIHSVTFTGSTAAGAKVAAAAAAHIKKQVLELGGSDAYVILEDADLDLAVKVCVEARLVNSGQSCVAAKRFVVVKSLRKEFEQRMKVAFEAARWGGDPMDKSMAIGPMARLDLRDSLQEQVHASVAAGAKILYGGKIPEGPGAFYPPTILTNVKKGMPAYDEELFGPVAAIIEAKDESDALRKANDSIYGLGGAIFSKNKKHAEQLAARVMQAGNCFVNAQVHSDPRLPFGGAKHSGYGRELGLFGIREFTNIKTVFVA
ncbi:MAG: NAD-dependent succinate-semialdehyde dehydrogenase [Bacteroidetes bacterium]|nr:NAD-dependent succinate-semialdehyde dehydrogenase [Bacteroidota bacterium]MBS1630303.1 NAD-dependent succinate-semialdehyde dehydrogenase [Bacteroidota bacterium]